MKKPIDEAREANRMRDLCVRSEQCSDDILRRLLKRGLTSASANIIIDRLIAEGFVDNQRFARAFTRDKYRFSGWGRHKIATALYARHISSSDIDTALQEIDLRLYAATAMKVMRTRLRMLPIDMDLTDKRMRLYRFGISRGFESKLITKILNSASLWQSPTD